jgi:hypothetical protein
VLDFIHLSATGVAEMAISTHFNGCPHTFVYIVYVLVLSLVDLEEILKKNVKEIIEVRNKHCKSHK